MADLSGDIKMAESDTVTTDLSGEIKMDDRGDIKMEDRGDIETGILEFELSKNDHPPESPVYGTTSKKWTVHGATLNTSPMLGQSYDISGSDGRVTLRLSVIRRTSQSVSNNDKSYSIRSPLRQVPLGSNEISPQTVNLQVMYHFGSHAIEEAANDVTIQPTIISNNKRIALRTTNHVWVENNDYYEDSEKGKYGTLYDEDIAFFDKIKDGCIEVVVTIQPIYAVVHKGLLPDRKDGKISKTSIATLDEKTVECEVEIPKEHFDDYVGKVDGRIGLQLVWVDGYLAILVKRLMKNVTSLKGRVLVFVKFDENEYKLVSTHLMELSFDKGKHDIVLNQVQRFVRKNKKIISKKCIIKLAFDFILVNMYGIVQLKPYQLKEYGQDVFHTREGKDLIVCITDKDGIRIGKFQRETSQTIRNIEYNFVVDGKTCVISHKHDKVDYDKRDYNIFDVHLQKGLHDGVLVVEIYPVMKEKSLSFAHSNQARFLVGVADFASLNLNQGIQINLRFVDFDDAIDMIDTD